MPKKTQATHPVRRPVPVPRPVRAGPGADHPGDRRAGARRPLRAGRRPRGRHRLHRDQRPRRRHAAAGDCAPPGCGSSGGAWPTCSSPSCSSSSSLQIVYGLFSDTPLFAREGTRPLTLLVLAALAPLVVVRRLLKHRTVTTGTLFGAISAFLLLPIAFYLRVPDHRRPAGVGVLRERPADDVVHVLQPDHHHDRGLRRPDGRHAARAAGRDRRGRVGSGVPGDVRRHAGRPAGAALGRRQARGRRRPGGVRQPMARRRANRRRTPTEARARRRAPGRGARRRAREVYARACCATCFFVPRIRVAPTMTRMTATSTSSCWISGQAGGGQVHPARRRPSPCRRRA